MLTGILYPTSGEANVLGFVPWRDRESLSYKIGSVFGQKSQMVPLAPHPIRSTCLRRYTRWTGRSTRRGRNFLVQAFEIGPFLNQPVRKASLGQRMRCEIAASILHGPGVIFSTSRPSGLDVVARQNVRQTLKKWEHEEKATVFLHRCVVTSSTCRQGHHHKPRQIVLDDK